MQTKSKITSKFQTTIPREIRDRLKLSVSDSIEWKIEEDKIVVGPVNKPFLKYKGSIKIKSGNIREDILQSRKMRVLKKK
ncbi:AbrB/MazE/SpoVT family DNA-binding domain-containing protein [Candidatus Scalindua japonica]|uniref:AbrB/MazE/SpoVT family DNA-binding domain-containing protein n=1 Tax=Candidatus Scalindua japonica TaxID=1284222 RepID=UPI000BDE8994|nr:AbrB/MazE/SpoVT family DNA-binding domain-containing protein [Candidatus Scalindua japonica]